jgi:hypothetical protein
VLVRRTAAVIALASLAIASASCRDLSSFSTSGDSFQGPVQQGDFVRAGIDGTVSACLTLDTSHLQDTPGFFSTSDGRFAAVAMRPIPQIWHDPLSTLSFGEGRLKNLVYVATATTPFPDGNGNDVLLVVSLMQSGDIEVRMIRGAPGLAVDGGASTGGNLFGIFNLQRQKVPCSY